MKIGSPVTWKWGRGKISGKIEEIFHESIEKKIKGKNIKRNGTKTDPAYLIKEDKKDAHVLKLKSELI